MEALSSTHIGFKAGSTLYYAEQQATRINHKLNLFVTINFAVLGISPKDTKSIFSKIRSQRFSTWIRRPPKNDPFSYAQATYVYAFENSNKFSAFYEDEQDNTHVHWYVHVPEQRITQFHQKLSRWIDEVVGHSDWPEAAVLVKDITRDNAVRYVLKGAREDTARHFGYHNARPQGLVYGRRTGTSRNIGPRARREMDTLLGIKRVKRSKPLFRQQ